MLKKPAAKRNTLALIAGLVWSVTGLGLATVATIWLLSSRITYLAMAVILGMGAGWAVYRFKFGKLAAQNLERIYSQSPGSDKICIFAFQNVRSYFLILIMMTMGYVVRHSGVPKPYLAPTYLAIGIALLLSSFNYYSHLRQRV